MITADDGFQIVWTEIAPPCAFLLKLTKTVSHFMKAFKAAKKVGCLVILSHEGNFFDKFIHDFSVGLSHVSLYLLSFSHDIKSFSSHLTN